MQRKNKQCNQALCEITKEEYWQTGWQEICSAPWCEQQFCRRKLSQHWASPLRGLSGCPFWRIACTECKCCSNTAACPCISINPVPSWSDSFFCAALLRFRLQGHKPAISEGRKVQKSTIARGKGGGGGGRCDKGPTALKIMPKGPENHMDLIKTGIYGTLMCSIAY